MHLVYGHVALLDAADLALEPGERSGLIGRNGTGKSSLLRIVGGPEKPEDGDLRVRNALFDAERRAPSSPSRCRRTVPG